MAVSEHNNDRCRFQAWSTGMHMPGIDGIDRTIRLCSPDIAPVRLLMRLLIDGSLWTSLVEARFPGRWFICLHLHIILLGLENGIMWELSFHCYSECQVRVLLVTYTSSTWSMFISAVEEDSVCVRVAHRKRECLPPNWYDVWHFIYCSWPVRLIMLPKAIGAENTNTTHTRRWIINTHTHARDLP